MPFATRTEAYDAADVRACSCLRVYVARRHESRHSMHRVAVCRAMKLHGPVSSGGNGLTQMRANLLGRLGHDAGERACATLVRGYSARCAAPSINSAKNFAMTRVSRAERCASNLRMC